MGGNAAHMMLIYGKLLTGCLSLLCPGSIDINGQLDYFCCQTMQLDEIHSSRCCHSTAATEN